MFLTSLKQLKNSFFSAGANSTKAGMIDCLLVNRPRYLLVDEIDMMPSILTECEGDRHNELKYGKTRHNSKRLKQILQHMH
jgi:hypothetical protein